ncbi:MAG: hypothetical protein NTU43_06715 [Bacteroidetes bacterium]|nr:hypothetical protein [Bacteroidota bacterium]
MKIFNNFIRITIGLFFLIIGLFHFYGYQTMAVFVPLPIGSKAFVLLVGSILSICAIGIIVNMFTRRALFITAIVLSFTGLLILTPMIYKSFDEDLKMIELPNLLKIIIAFAVFIYLISSKPQHK